jgi:hypothetical protein
MAIPSHWIEHRRGTDRELVGWIAPEGEDFVAIDLLGRAASAPSDWQAAEECLEDGGIGYLADPYELLVDGVWLRVRIVEVSSETVWVKDEDWGAIDAPGTSYTLAFPPGGILRRFPRS